MRTVILPRVDGEDRDSFLNHKVPMKAKQREDARPSRVGGLRRERSRSHHDLIEFGGNNDSPHTTQSRPPLQKEGRTIALKSQAGKSGRSREETLMVKPAEPPTLKLAVEGCFDPWTLLDVAWTTTHSTDANPKHRLFDFLSLHKYDDPPEEYMSSLYMLGAQKGHTEFVAPHEPGTYRVSAVRDVWATLEAVPSARSSQEFMALASKCRPGTLMVLAQSSPIIVKGGIDWLLKPLDPAVARTKPCSGRK